MFVMFAGPARLVVAASTIVTGAGGVVFLARNCCKNFAHFVVPSISSRLFKNILKTQLEKLLVCMS